jgi:Polyketide cyclase / dehydrase and lipid transport
MAKLELSRELSMKPEDAWAHASNLAELGSWMQMHEGWRSELPDEITVGTTVVGVAGAKGMRNRVTWTVRRFDPPSFLEITGDGVGGTKYGLILNIKPTGDGCTFVVKMELGGKPLFGPIGAVAVRAVKGDIDRSIKKFESLYS